jgi:hypothetical protein
MVSNEAAFPGFLAFAPPFSSRGSTKPINIGQLIAAIARVPNPGAAPELSSVMPPFVGSPSVHSVSSKAVWQSSFGGGLAGAAASAFLFRLPELGPLLGLLGVCGSAYLAFRGPPEIANARKLVSQLSASWRNVETQWNQAKDARQFTDQRREADELARGFQNLGAEEARELSNLQAKARDAQLRTFLQRFYIDQAKIEGVGNARKIVLRSYGIETAADIDQRRIQAIKGFGPSIAGSIVAWRMSLERRFVFNPNQPLNPADVSAVKAAVANKRIDLEKKLRIALSQLEKRSSEILSLRNSLKSAAEQVWKAKGQAELDRFNLAKAYYPTSIRLAALAGSVVAGLLIQSVVFSNPTSTPDVSRSSHISLSPSSSSTSQTSNGGTMTAQAAPTLQSQPMARGETSESANSARVGAASEPKGQFPSQSPLGSSSNKTSATSEPEQPRLPGGGALPLPPPHKTAGIPGLPADSQNSSPRTKLDKTIEAASTPRPAPLVRDTTDGRFGSVATAADGQSPAQPSVASGNQTKTALLRAQPPTEAPPLPPPQIIPVTPGLMPTTGSGNEKSSVATESPSPLDREMILGIQSRLQELGFLDRYFPGVWDADSRKALREFKLTNHLINSDIWDLAAEQALYAPSPLRANQSFIGGWSVAPGCIAAGDVPLSVNSYRAKSDGSLCNFQTVTPAGQGWNVQAWCSRIGRVSWPANIRLEVSGDQLTWKSERGLKTYFRCQT